MVFKLNKAIVGMFLLISFPPMMPLIIFLSYRTGRYWTQNGTTGHWLNTPIYFKNVSGNFGQYLYGSLTLAIVAATVFGLLTFALLKLIKALKQYSLTAQKETDGATAVSC
jgi:ABC-type Fe3+ transport system permease subunit